METATATAPAQQYDGFVGQRKPVSDSNPHDNRYAYIPPVVRAASEPRVTGYSFFRPGTLITFQTISTGGWPNPAFMEDSKARGLIREFSAEMCARNALVQYQSVEGHDVGYSPLSMLTGDPLAQRYFDAIHPPFAIFDHECPYGLDVCPTCRTEWLESEQSKGYFRQNADGLDADKALAVKEALYDANQRFLEFAQNTWGGLSDQFERSRNQAAPFVMDKTHHHYRKCLHQPTFEDREITKIQTMSGVNARSFNPNDFTDEELAEIYAKRAAKAKTLPDENTIIDARRPPSEGFAEGQPVICEGENGTITEIKTAGWFVITLNSGETKTVRKDKFELKEQQNEQDIQP